MLLQLFEFSEPVTVYVFLRTSMAPNHVVLAETAVNLNAQNNYQATAKLRVRRDALRELCRRPSLFTSD